MFEVLRRRASARNPADQSTVRMRRAHLTSASSILAQGIAFGVGLVSVPLTVSYLGQERYGIWITLSSFLTWLTLADLGLGGNGLINTLADANGRDDRQLGREMVATAFWSLAGIGGVLAVGCALALSFVPLDTLFRPSAHVVMSELRWAVVLAFGSWLLVLPLNTVTAIFHGYQEGYLSNTWAVVGSLASLLALVGVTRLHGGLVELVVALCGVRLVVAVAGGIYLFAWHRPWLIPAPTAITRRALSRLFSLGIRYQVAQVAGIAMFHSQPFIITQALGPTQVGIFAVAYRLMTFPLQLIQIFTFPLMPAYGEARARQDWAWIRATLRRSLTVSAVGISCMALAMVIFARPIVRLWVGPGMEPDQSLVLALGLYVFVAGLVTPVSVMLYGLERIGPQAMFASVNALVTVVLGLWLTRHWGLAGMASAMAIALALVNPLGQAVELRAAFRAQRPGAVASLT